MAIEPFRLVTSRLLLRPFTLDDAPSVQRLAGDVAVADTTDRVPHPYEDGMAEAWIACGRRREIALFAGERIPFHVKPLFGGESFSLR